MVSNTPQFHKALKNILKDLQPCKKTCKQCNEVFHITKEDIEMFDTLSVPPPVLCSECKRQRRLIFMNYTSLYKRTCDAPDHSEKIISSMPQDSLFPVYDYKYWWSDEWDPTSYARGYKEKSFFEQLRDLHGKVSQPALTRDTSSIGSEYTLYGYQLKNCYFTFGGARSENVYYSNWPYLAKDCLDTLIAKNTDLSAHSVFLEDSYNCKFSYFSNDCLDSDFLYDCKNCNNCFGCVNLRNKQYYFFNEPLTKEEYQKRWAEINLGDREVVQMHEKKFWELVKKSPVRAVRIERSENVSGNYIENSKNCYKVFRALDCQNVRYGDFVIKMSDSMHATTCANAELLYETAGVRGHSYNVKFSFNAPSCEESEFLINCKGCSNCFGCSGLRNKEHYILNKQYEPEEYFQIVDTIKTKMLESGEYGEFFPPQWSPFAYNGSLAEIVFPLTKEKAQLLGALWHDAEEQDLKGLSPMKFEDVPKDIRDIGDDIVEKAIMGKTGKAFRVIARELEFYRRHKLAFPTKHSRERMKDRFTLLNNLRIEKTTCYSCKKHIDSAFKNGDGFKPYCEECYQAGVA